jgi:hypothetical protein
VRGLEHGCPRPEQGVILLQTLIQSQTVKITSFSAYLRSGIAFMVLRNTIGEKLYDLETLRTLLSRGETSNVEACIHWFALSNFPASAWRLVSPTYSDRST